MNTDKLRELLAKAVDGHNTIERMRVFVTSKERIKKPEGDDLFDESVSNIQALHSALPELLDELDRLRNDATDIRNHMSRLIDIIDDADKRGGLWFKSRATGRDSAEERRDEQSWTDERNQERRNTIEDARAAIDAAIAAQEGM